MCDGFASLPDSIVAIIFSHLESADRTRARLICKQAKRVIDQDVTVVNRDFWLQMEPLSSSSNGGRPGPAIRQSVIRARAIWPSLQVMNLSAMQLKDLGVRELARCRWESLRVLSLGQNLISQVGARTLAQGNLTAWPYLRKLDLNRNRINDADFQELLSVPWMFLEELDLGCCQISLTSEIGKYISKHWDSGTALPALRKLSLACNPLHSKFPSKLAAMGCPLLEELNLKGVQMGSEEAIHLATVAHQWPRFRSLDLGNLGEDSGEYCPGDDLTGMLMRSNEIGPKGAVALASAATSWRNLKRLVLYKNRVGPEGIRYLAKANLYHLNELDLGFCGLGPMGAAELAAGLWRWPVQKLNLEGNALEDAGFWRLIIPALTDIGVTDLNLAGNQLSSSAVWALVAHVGLNLTATLRTLSLANNMLGSEGAEVLLGKQWEVLESLNLFRTGLCSRGVGAIALTGHCFPALRKLYLGCNLVSDREPLVYFSWQKLEVLSLITNEIGPNSAQALAKAKTMGQLPVLQELDLFYNKLGCTGIQTLMGACWEGLKVLNMGNNEIDATGALILARAAPEKLPAVEKLHLGSNRLGDAGLEALVSSAWPKVKSIDLTGNSIGPHGANALSKMASHFPNLRVLLLASNQLGCLGAAHLAKAAWSTPEHEYKGVFSVTLDLLREYFVRYGWHRGYTSDDRYGAVQPRALPLNAVQQNENNNAQIMNYHKRPNWPMFELLVTTNNSIMGRGMLALRETQKSRPTLKVIA